MTDQDPWWRRTIDGCLGLFVRVLGGIGAWAFLRGMRRWHRDHPEPAEESTQASPEAGRPSSDLFRGR